APFLTGVTISGGEATMQAEFVRELFLAMKGDDDLAHLSTLVDTNGSADDQVWESLLDVMDGAMVDLKAIDPATHVNLTARDNTRVLASIRFLAERDKLEEIRLLIVPGYNDDAGAIERTALWLADLGVDPKVKIIGYRSHGVRTEAAHIPDATRASLDGIAAVLAKHGLGRLTVV
ncbi:MAG: radical SAM protein, partial [Actinomycetia bacterium]|nr:radical SAM protein [Actinomycetes bacterium]